MHYVTDVRKVRWQPTTPSSANVTLNREPLFSNFKNLLFVKKTSEIVTRESMKPDKGVIIIIIILFNVIQPAYVPIIVMKIIEDYSHSLLVEKAYYEDHYVSASKRGSNGSYCPWIIIKNFLSMQNHFPVTLVFTAHHIFLLWSEHIHPPMISWEFNISNASIFLVSQFFRRVILKSGWTLENFLRTIVINFSFSYL